MKPGLFPAKQVKKPIIFSIERFFNLTTPAIFKYEKANQNMGRYTVFINKKHTLAHVVIKGEDMWLRVPIKAKKLHREIDEVVQAYFTTRLCAYLAGF